MRSVYFVFLALSLVSTGCGDSSAGPSPQPKDASGHPDVSDSGPADSGAGTAGAGGTANPDAASDGNLGGSSGSGDAEVDAGASDASDDGNAQDAGCPPSGVPGKDSDGDGTNDENDCLPCDPTVHPNVIAWHTKPRSDGSWDWNCDGNEEKQYGLGKCVYPGCTKTQGFYKVPACGGKGQLISYCISNKYSCGTQWAASGSTTQGCR